MHLNVRPSVSAVSADITNGKHFFIIYFYILRILNTDFIILSDLYSEEMSLNEHPAITDIVYYTT